MLYKKVLNLNVTEGPSKMDLIIGLAYAYDEANPHCVRLRTELPRTDSRGVQLTPQEQQEQQKLFDIVAMRSEAKKCHLRVRITAIEHENGSGESFIISGYVLAGSYPSYTEYPLEGYYSARNRKGRLELTVTLAE